MWRDVGRKKEEEKEEGKRQSTKEAKGIGKWLLPGDYKLAENS